MSTPEHPLLLTVQEVSQILRIHRPKVYDLIKAGVIDGFKLGSDWRVKRESIEKLTGPIPENFFGEKGGNRRKKASPSDEPFG
ncbi:MAG: helix-turn-helix domain-containing protein [Bdellovibrionota bacterium]|nr:MAG: helix-turn-helix domain-containing protein [Bdellovibrionota bacterium]